MLENIAPGECYSEDYKRFQLKGHNARDSKSQNHLVVVQFEKRSRYWVCQELMGEFLGNQDS